MISKELRKEIDETIARDRRDAAKENITFMKRFRKECIIINFEKDYGSALDGYNYGKLYGCSYGVGTILDSIDEMFDKYAEQLAEFVPFVILDQDTAVVMRIFKRNERKHEKRNKEIISKSKKISKGALKLLRKVRDDSGIDITYNEAMNGLRSQELAKAFEKLDEKQKRRVTLHCLCGYSLTTIAQNDGVSVAAVHYSVNCGLENLKKILHETIG